MKGIMYYLAIIVALSSTFINTLAQNNVGTRAVVDRAALCDPNRKDGNDDKKFGNFYNDADDVSDKVLGKLTLKKLLSVASNPEHSTTRTRDQDVDVLANHKNPGKSVVNANTQKGTGKSSDIVGLAEVVRGESIRQNRNKPTFRLFPSDIKSSGSKYNPPPYVDNQNNPLKIRKSNANVNTNVNTNVNKISIGNGGRLKNQDKEEIRDQGNENGTVAVIADSNGGEKNSSLAITEGPITPGTQNSVQLKDTEKLNATSSSHSLEIVTSSTTPIVHVVESTTVAGKRDGTGRKKKSKKRRKGKGRGRGKQHKKRRNRKQRRPTQQQQNTLVKKLDVPATESLSNVSETSTVKNIQETTESSQSSTTNNSVVKDEKSKEKSVLTQLILKLLIVKTGKMSSAKILRLKRLINQLNIDEKQTILRDLAEEMNKDLKRVKLGEKTEVKRVVMSESNPQLIVGVLGGSAKESQPSVGNDQDGKTLNIPESPEKTKNRTKDVAENAIGEESAKKSQGAADKSSIKESTDNEPREKQNAPRSDDRVASVLENSNDNAKNQNVMVPIEALKLSDADKKFKSRARNHGQYSVVPNDSNKNFNQNFNVNSNANINKMYSDVQDHEGTTDRAIETNRPKNRTDGNLEKPNEHPASPTDRDSLQRGRNINTNKNVTAITIGGDSQISDKIKIDIENTRRSAPRRSPRRRNRNRHSNDNVNENVNVNKNVNINRNVNVNNMQATDIDKFDNDDKVIWSRRTMDRSISKNVNSNSNSNKNTNVNKNVADSSVRRPVPRPGQRKDEVKLSQEEVGDILREVTRLQKQLAENKAAATRGSNRDRRRPRQRHNDQISLER